MKIKRRLERHLVWSFCVLVAVIASGCVSQEAALLRDADRYTSELKEQDKLPGYSSTEHGRSIASAPLHVGHVSYPASVTVRAWKEGDESTYWWYDLVKDTPESSWRLVKAARLDKDDKVVEQLFPK